MYVFIAIFFLLRTIVGIDQKNWLPKYINESLFDEPFDYVSDSYLPNLVKDEAFDWISSSGTTLFDIKKSYVAFTGTRKNSAKNYKSVFTKESGLIVLCESSATSSQTFNLNMNCKVLENKSLLNNDGIYFGAVVRSVKYKEDTAAFIYCDPLWFDANSKYKEPSGKCYLSLIKDFNISEKHDFQVCSSFDKCLGGFSVDLFSDSQNLEVIFGLPFSNSTYHLKQAQSNKMSQALENKGNFFNFGYSVSFAKDGSLYVSSPVSDENSAFVKMLSGEKFYPQDKKTQNYGGFGTSLDTVKIGDSLYGAVIGAPYQSNQNSPNVGAVFLACKGHATDMVVGENKDDYFGYAVARIGDLDYDGAEEFAVSAPSLNLDRPGKLYIYKTTPDCRIQKKPLQIYQSKIYGFGVSISRGFDLDFNGWPDFFVTSLNSKKPYLFKMPSQQKVTCHWPKTKFDQILSKDQSFDVKILLKVESTVNFDDYFFQVALDFLNKGEPRFELVSQKIVNNVFTLTIKPLIDVIDIDLKTIPLQLAIKGTRKCKKSDSENCFQSTAFNIQWMDCEKLIILTQYTCSESKCVSELSLKVKPDSNGTVIYLGNTTNYQRTLEVTVINTGPEASPRIYMSIKSNSDIEITNIKCKDYKHIATLSSGMEASTIAIKETVNPLSELKILVEILYKQLNVTKPKSSIDFKVWGINEDENSVNNNATVHYSILFKPNLMFSSKKAQDTIVDDRLKPPYIEAFKSIPVHEFGTNLRYSYIIENKGPELKNVEFKFRFPHQTEDKKFILYILDRIRLSINETWISVLPILSRNNKEVGHCSIPSYLINPLEVKAIETHKHDNSEMPAPKRLKRSSGKDRIVTYIDERNNSMSADQLSQDETVRRVSVSDRSTMIDCNTTDPKLGRPRCGEIICKLPLVPVNSVFNFDFRAWLFTKTFFDARLADLIVVTSMQSNVGDLPPGLTVGPDTARIAPFSVAQKVIFSKMVIRASKPMPLWPLILAAIMGIIFLAIIIIIAYYCGFFKRKRLEREMKKKRMNRLKNVQADKEPLNSN